MAAPPVKSQPLHNFSLPHLKWVTKNTSSSADQNQNHRSRRPDQPTRNPEPENPVAEDEDEGNKPWNLRPRKVSSVVKTTSSSKKEMVAADDKKGCNGNGVVKSQRLQQNNGGDSRKDKKRRLWIALSREEIEEDIFALTGGKPARRPRKWPKNVQKQLDNVFPGLYLVGFEADSYKAMMLWWLWC